MPVIYSCFLIVNATYTPFRIVGFLFEHGDKIARKILYDRVNVMQMLAKKGLRNIGQSAGQRR